MSTNTGTATVILNAAETSISYTVAHTVPTPTGAHFHTGFAFENGGVSITLSTAANPIVGTSMVSAAQVANIKAGRIYINIHSAAPFGGGEIRGQLLLPNEQLYRTPLGGINGGNETPPNASAATGGMQVVLSADAGTLVCNGAYSGIQNPTGAHIHVADAGVSGPLVVTLAITSAGMNGTLSCAANQPATPNLISEMNAFHTYVNIHSPAPFAGGEIRGQLIQP